jgi:NitT/TauT family transport system substrate-binding protein
LLNEPAGVEAEDALPAGAVQGVVGFYDHCIDLQSKGEFVVAVVVLAQAPGEVEMVGAKHPEVRAIADFKGHAVGVTGLGSSTDFLTLYLEIKAGLKVGDVLNVPVGADQTFIDAIQEDKIQAGMTTEPTISRLMKMKLATPLVDMRTRAETFAAVGGPYPAASLYTERSYVETHRDTVQKLVNAFVRSLQFIAGNSAETIADQMPSNYYVGDKKMYVTDLADGLEMFTVDGRMPQGGPETVLKVLSTFSPLLRGKTIDLSVTYTSEFVDRVHDNGAR